MVLPLKKKVFQVSCCRSSDILWKKIEAWQRMLSSFVLTCKCLKTCLIYRWKRCVLLGLNLQTRLLPTQQDIGTKKDVGALWTCSGNRMFLGAVDGGSKSGRVFLQKSMCDEHGDINDPKPKASKSQNGLEVFWSYQQLLGFWDWVKSFESEVASSASICCYSCMLFVFPWL